MPTIDELRALVLSKKLGYTSYKTAMAWSGQPYTGKNAGLTQMWKLSFNTWGAPYNNTGSLGSVICIRK